MGLLMGQYVLETMRPRRVEVRRVVVCQTCGAHNPLENRFCSSCGHSLYPPPRVTCPSCRSAMPATYRFCGNCRSALHG